MSCKNFIQFILSFSSFLRCWPSVVLFYVLYLAWRWCFVKVQHSRQSSRWLCLCWWCWGHYHLTVSTPDKGKEVTAPHYCSTGNQRQLISLSLSQLGKLIETPDFSGPPGLQYQKLSRRRHSGKRCHPEVQHSQLRLRLCVRSGLGRFRGCYSLSKQSQAG